MCRIIANNDLQFGCPIIYTNTIHNAIFQQCLIQQSLFLNWEVIFGNIASNEEMTISSKFGTVDLNFNRLFLPSLDTIVDFDHDI